MKTFEEIHREVMQLFKKRTALQKQIQEIERRVAELERLRVHAGQPAPEAA